MNTKPRIDGPRAVSPALAQHLSMLKLTAGGAERAAHGGGQRVSQAELGWVYKTNDAKRSRDKSVRDLNPTFLQNPL